MHCFVVCTFLLCDTSPNATQQPQANRWMVNGNGSTVPHGISMQVTSKPIVLVACGAGKVECMAPAKDLYTGDLFRKSRQWAERHGSHWFILSAKHGLLRPDLQVYPYNLSLASASPGELATWGLRVEFHLNAQLTLLRAHDRPVVVLAGRLYRRWCEGRGNSVPMRGMGLGQQKAWLKSQLAATELEAA